MSGEDSIIINDAHWTVRITDDGILLDPNDEQVIGISLSWEAYAVIIGQANRYTWSQRQWMYMRVADGGRGQPRRVIFDEERGVSDE